MVSSGPRPLDSRILSCASTPHPYRLRSKSEPTTSMQPGLPEHHFLPSGQPRRSGFLRGVVLWIFVMGIKCDVTPGPEDYTRMTSSPLLRSSTDHLTSLLLCLAPPPRWVDHGIACGTRSVYQPQTQPEARCPPDIFKAKG
ncbi:unnamed protein product [Musa textilis]